jgi:hypothetical protein
MDQRRPMEHRFHIFIFSSGWLNTLPGHCSYSLISISTDQTQRLQELSSPPVMIITIFSEKSPVERMLYETGNNLLDAKIKDIPLPSPLH